MRCWRRAGCCRPRGTAGCKRGGRLGARYAIGAARGEEELRCRVARARSAKKRCAFAFRRWLFPRTAACCRSLPHCPALRSAGVLSSSCGRHALPPARCATFLPDFCGLPSLQPPALSLFVCLLAPYVNSTLQRAAFLQPQAKCPPISPIHITLPLSLPLPSSSTSATVHGVNF